MASQQESLNKNKAVEYENLRNAYRATSRQLQELQERVNALYFYTPSPSFVVYDVTDGS
jgi:hypothetical protein